LAGANGLSKQVLMKLISEAIASFGNFKTIGKIAESKTTVAYKDFAHSPWVG
jgi:hypothetical protein